MTALESFLSQRLALDVTISLDNFSWIAVT